MLDRVDPESVGVNNGFVTVWSSIAFILCFKAVFFVQVSHDKRRCGLVGAGSASRVL